MVAIVLVGTGLAALTSGLGAITKSFRKSVEREEVERLAQDKYDELVATGEYVVAAEGEYEDERNKGAKWSIEPSTTSIEGVVYVRVTVEVPRSGRSALVEGLVYSPPQESSLP